MVNCKCGKELEANEKDKCSFCASFESIFVTCKKDSCNNMVKDENDLCAECFTDENAHKIEEKKYANI
jgi:hypothetical protein